MYPAILLKTAFTVLTLFYAASSFSQNGYQFTLVTRDEECLKAAASIQVSGTEAADTLTIDWSTGQHNIKEIDDLTSGDYFVRIKIKHHDSIIRIKDTTIAFLIGKEQCIVYVDKYFSPNNDNYHDNLQISNTGNYPDFELQIFNKWGQKVHSQKGTYTPWDGKWNGLDLPDGTYYYVFFYEAGKRNKLEKGDVTILR